LSNNWRTKEVEGCINKRSWYRRTEGIGRGTSSYTVTKPCQETPTNIHAEPTLPSSIQTHHVVANQHTCIGKFAQYVYIIVKGGGGYTVLWWQPK